VPRIAIVLGLVLGAFAGWVAYGLNDRFDVEAYAARYPALAGNAAPGPEDQRPVTATFLGVSTVLLRDGETAILTDGFFSRPGLARTLFGRLAPDEARIAEALEQAGVTRLAAVAVVHSHYDHAMDAGEVALRTGAVLVGSRSTAQVGRGAGLSEERILVPEPGEALQFGAFTLWMVPTAHIAGSGGPPLPGEIREPLVPPARVGAWREGRSLGVLVEHPRGRVLVQGSAGFLPGGYRSERADVVFLGVGGLGRKEPAYRERYLREVVDAVGARRVVPIHWDDFTRPLGAPLVPFPRLVDRFDETMESLAAWSRAGEGRVVTMPRAYEELPLF